MEGEELPEDDDDDVELPEGVDVDPVVLALETEPDLEKTVTKCKDAIGKKKRTWIAQMTWRIRSWSW